MVAGLAIAGTPFFQIAKKESRQNAESRANGRGLALCQAAHRLTVTFESMFNHLLTMSRQSLETEI